MSEGRTLQIFRDGRKHTRQLNHRLPPGAQGNLETLVVMKQIVLADAREPDLKNYVLREIVGLEKKTTRDAADAAFAFCRDAIVYSPEQDGLETVADLWSCLYALKREHPSGDCAIKCVALATCFSFLNLKPAFVAIKQIPDAESFNHVFLTCEIDGREIPFDPTPPEFRPGDELESFTKLIYRIF